MNLEMQPKTLFLVGIWCFLIIAIMNSLSLMFNWEIINIFNKISAIAGIFFNLALVGSFLYLRNQVSEQFTESTSEVMQGEDINEIIKEIKKGGKKKASK